MHKRLRIHDRSSPPIDHIAPYEGKGKHVRGSQEDNEDSSSSSSASASASSDDNYSLGCLEWDCINLDGSQIRLRTVMDGT
ncbi:hypothetical protein CRG98_034037 [Punica granatum]|uniref:Uncharacterized protein n=1 Tax=Punica granatum TaxID=22663 RepID=A0A2I0IND5_PUNGR|nr:hypothetical protein CRG98_034037 [Punica granatum]